MAEIEHVTSEDGTAIALERASEGPQKVVTLPGGANVRAAWAGVAGLLDGSAEVWLMDRRGKGDSGDTEPYSFAREVEDVHAVASAFEGDDLVLAAHSSGALCLLLAAARAELPARALVVYEPPWPLDGRALTTEELDEMDAHLAAGDPEAAVETGLRRLVGLPPQTIEAMKHGPGWAERVAYAHTWTREGRELDRMPTGTEPLSAVGTPVLLLVGELSPDHLRASSAAVAQALPTATVVELPGQAHAALQTAPDLVADAVRSIGGRW